jgi:hypothetical protein
MTGIPPCGQLASIGAIGSYCRDRTFTWTNWNDLFWSTADMSTRLNERRFTEARRPKADRQLT